MRWDLVILAERVRWDLEILAGKVGRDLEILRRMGTRELGKRPHDSNEHDSHQNAGETSELELALVRVGLDPRTGNFAPPVIAAARFVCVAAAAPGLHSRGAMTGGLQGGRKSISSCTSLGYFIRTLRATGRQSPVMLASHCRRWLLWAPGLSTKSRRIRSTTIASC